MTPVVRSLTIIALLLASVPLLRPVGAQDVVQLDSASLKKSIQDMGYETRDLGTTGKVEFKIERAGLTLPIGAEVSPSKSYIWFTLLLRSSLAEDALNGAKASNLLRANGRIQPSQFFLTSRNNLMLALAVENRNTTPAQLRKAFEKLAQDAADQKEFWQEQQQ